MAREIGAGLGAADRPPAAEPRGRRPARRRRGGPCRPRVGEDQWPRPRLGRAPRRL